LTVIDDDSDAFPSFSQPRLKRTSPFEDGSVVGNDVGLESFAYPIQWLEDQKSQALSDPRKGNWLGSEETVPSSDGVL
jgi:hypothetical protein